MHVFTLLASLVGNIFRITTFMRIRKQILLLIAHMAASQLLLVVFLIPCLIFRVNMSSNAFPAHENRDIFPCNICTFLSDVLGSAQYLVVIITETVLAISIAIL